MDNRFKQAELATWIGIVINGLLTAMKGMAIQVKKALLANHSDLQKVFVHINPYDEHEVMNE